MAEWIPKIVPTNRGLIKNNIPYGYFDTAKDYMGTNLQVDGDGARGNKGYQGVTAESWSAAYGTDCIDIGDTTGNNQLLLEIKVETPENAPFFAQTLCFKGNITKREIVVTGNSYFEYTINIIDIVRREYEYEGALPTETTLYNTQSQATIVYNRAEDENGLLYTRFIDNLWVALGRTTIDDNKYFGMNFYGQGHIWYQQTPPVDKREWTHMAIALIEYHVLDEAFGGEFLPEETDDPNEDPEDDGPGGGGPGGEGEKDKHQDAIPEPDLPPLSATAAGFVTVYKLYESNMQTFAKKLFDPTVWDAVKQLLADPLDFICGILILPFSPSTTRLARPILQQVPPIAWDYYYPVIEQQYHVVDCGTIDVPMFYKTAFDYNPYSKDELYLPYCGYVSLDPDEVQGHTLKIKYHVDCMTGDCIAFVIRTTISEMTPKEQVIAQHSGNCGVRIPFGRQSFDAAVSASIQMISAAGGAAGGIAMLAGGAGGLAGGGKQLAEGMIASSVAGIGAGAVNGSKAHVERGGVMGTSAGYMGVQTPYLIRRIPYQSLPDKGYYRRLNGYPCNQAGRLLDFEGFTAVESIELSGIGATQEEKTEILNMLTGGVII